MQPSKAFYSSVVDGLQLTAELDRLAVFKQDDGEYLWVNTSSNAYEDREGEIVSQAALEADAARMDATKEYGPLRWWHVGEIEYGKPLDWQTSFAGRGLDIGDCIFVATHGRMMIEGGTFRTKEIAMAVAKAAPMLRVSRGFTHPMDEPKGGVYHNIRGIERSLLPAGREANSLTALAVTRGNQNMATLKEKWGEFVGLFGGDESKAKEFAGQVATKDFAADAAGVAFKETVLPVHTHPIPVAPIATVKADTPPMDTPSADAPTDAPPDSAPLVGDMTLADLVNALAPAIANAIAAAVQPTQNELDTTVAALDTAQKELAALKGLTTKEAGTVAALTNRVQALEGNAPTGAHIPSRDNPAKTKEQLGVMPLPPKNEIDTLTEFFFKPTQPSS